MKISKETLAILKNYVEINKSLYFRKGSTIMTVSGEDITIYSRATLTESFPENFGVYDLSQFLSAIDLVDSPELIFQENSVLIRSGNRSIEWEFANVKVLDKALTKNATPRLPSSGIDFSVTKKDLSDLLSAVRLFGLTQISISRGDTGKVRLSVWSEENKHANKFWIDLDQDVSSEFNVIFSVSRLKLVSGAYDIRLSSQGDSTIYGYFKNTEKSVEYWIVADEESKMYATDTQQVSNA